MRSLVVLSLVTLAAAKYTSEYVVLPGHKVKNDFKLRQPYEYTKPEELPAAWDWSNINGTNYLTKSLNQHIPQYCGSCWAHGAMSSLADRIKIARKGRGIDINLAIQFILNCGTESAGSCHGGSHLAAFEFIKSTGYVPYDTCLSYAACSAESREGDCNAADYKCSAINTCRTCSTFKSAGGICAPLSIFPNASIAEYGEVPASVQAIKAELYNRGPIACGVNAEPILQYHGGVYDNPDEDQGINHIVTMTGWGRTAAGKEYWIVRNSWGEYWGEMGFFRIATGSNQLGIEAECAWATPASWTEVNYPCDEDGGNCQDKPAAFSPQFVDPAWKLSSPFARSHGAALQPQN